MANKQTVAFGLALAAAVLGPASASAQCCGDCDGDGQIAINELITAVNQALNACVAHTPTQTEAQSPATTPTRTATAGPARFVDNADGTIADLETGLMWEKKIGLDGAVDGLELHDADNRYPWGGTCTGEGRESCRTDGDCPAQEICTARDQQRTDLTIFQWVEEVNLEWGTGFAGFNDWRIPTVEELRTLRESTDAPPVTNPALNGWGCGTTCTDLSRPACSCTAPDPYWSATSSASDPTQAWRVNFEQGDVLPNRKVDRLRVRAVRHR